MATRYLSAQRRGIALVVVILIIALMAALVCEFNYDCQVRLHLADNTQRAYQALYCAEAGVAVATAALGQYDNVWMDDALSKLLSGMVKLPVGQGYCTISVTGESGRININALKTRRGQLVRYRIDQMLRLIDLLNTQDENRRPISYGLVPAIIDWVDSDNDVTVLPFVKGENAGAESDYYLGLEKPYHCKNGPFEVLGELMLVKGMTPEILQGRVSGESVGPTAGMEQFLTVYGEGKLNINEASPIVVQTLSEQIDKALAESIVEHRPYRSLRELTKVPGMTPEAFEAIQELATVQPSDQYYAIAARGIVGTCVKIVRIVVQKDRYTGQFTPVVRWEL